MVHEPNTSLRPRLALLGEWPPDIQGRRVVAGIEGRETMTKIILVRPRARGPSKGAEPRDILIDLDGTGADGAGQ